MQNSRYTYTHETPFTICMKELIYNILQVYVQLFAPKEGQNYKNFCIYTNKTSHFEIVKRVKYKNGRS